MKPVINYGFTFYFVIGKWNTPKIQLMPSSRSLRICIGFASIRIGVYDIEAWERRVFSAYIEADDKLRATSSEQKQVPY